MKKITIVVVILVVLVSAVVVRISMIKGENEHNQREGIEKIQQREGFPVVVTPVNQNNFEVWREIQGKVEGYRQAFISTPDAARVAAIKYKVGDQVKADTPIISLDENDPKNISKIKLLRTVHENATKEYERYENLYKSGGVSKDVLDKIYIQLKTARTNLDAARATVHLTSPIDGFLLALYTRVGENTESDKTLAIISALDTVRIVTGVSDQDINEFQLDQPVQIHLDQGVVLSGSVDRISLGANPDTGLFDLELRIQNEKQILRVGMFVTARIRIEYLEETLSVDSRCLLRSSEGQDYLYQVRENIVHKVSVQVKAMNEQHSALDHIDGNFPVVLHGKSLLYDGAQVKIIPEATP